VRFSLCDKLIKVFSDKYSSDSQSSFITSRFSKCIVDDEIRIWHTKSLISYEYSIDDLSLFT